MAKILTSNTYFLLLVRMLQRALRASLNQGDRPCRRHRCTGCWADLVEHTD